jgi:hypothetical protein
VRAEDFVRRSGYTSYSPDPSEAEGSFNLFEHELPPEQVLADRHNTLEPHAYGVNQHGRGMSDPGWTVVFLGVRDARGTQSPEYGAAVIMDLDGRHLYIAHLAYQLRMLEHRLCSSEATPPN